MKTSAKSSKRRLKKSVRRTFGGVCLASAILVAAIPFPDAAAYDPADNTVAALPVYGVTSSDYITDINFYVDNNTLGYPNTDKNFTDIPKQGTVVSQTSKGFYQLDWQFEYVTYPNQSEGYITSYNKNYQVPDTSIDGRVYYDYVYIYKDEIENYYADTVNSKRDVTYYYGDEPDPTNPTYHTNKASGVETVNYVHTLSGAFDITNPDHKWLKDNFETETDKYIADYNEYTLDPTKPEPLPISHSLADKYKTDSERLQYFCKSVFGDGTDINLVEVSKKEYDPSNPANSNYWVTVYVPRVLDLASVPDNRIMTIGGKPYCIDSFGFLSTKYDSIVGIATKAFYGIENINSLEIANEVAYIGDSAFEKCKLKKVILPETAIIGNRAFADSLLNEVTIPENVNKIGAEAFYGCPISSIVIPDSCTYVGPGAFANSAALKNVTFNVLANPEKKVCKYAFYNDLALANVDFGNSKVTEIGEGAFAVNALDSGDLSNFTFPSFIGVDGSHNTLIGERALAGRMGLKQIVIPDNVDGALNDTIFYGCGNLESVTFGETCYNMTYNSATDGDTDEFNTMFYTVTNPNFYVRGPKLAGDNYAAAPRQSTWIALYDYNSVSKSGRHVPYVYSEGGKDYYEVSDGKYLMVIEKDTGELTSCTFLPTVTPAPIDEFVIPAKVGTTSVSGLKEGCFDGSVGNEGVLDYIVNLVIEDGSSISSIDANTFKGADILETVYIGDSVQSIGESAFEDCPKLDEVTIAENIQTIGPKAFQNCSKLEDIYFAKPSDYSIFSEGKIGENAFNTLGNKLTLHGEIATGYAPFEWATNPSNYANKSKSIRTLYKTPAPTSLSVILDNGNNLATLVDYPHYEYLNTVMYDPDLDELVELGVAPSSSDPNYQNTILYKIENNLPINYLEETMMKNTADIYIPEGVESIDTYGFFNDSSLNPNGVEPYSNRASAEAYFGTRNVLPYESYNDYGLFNGYYGSVASGSGMREFDTSDTANEADAKGNDRITSVIMNDVVYLPDRAFDNCENLQTVSLGSKIEEMGELPFSGCGQLSSIACGNDNFVCNNGIIYENTGSGKEIVECLESRGGVVGRNTVSTANDPDLVEVKEIRPNAFENCDDVFAVDFAGATKLKAIPANCFDGCTQLSEIDIPENVAQIDKEAFAHTGDYTKVTVRNRNLFLGKDTNGVPGEKIKTAYYVTYEDALSRKEADDQGYITELILDDVWTVKYYDQTGRDLLGTEQVVNGKNAEGLDEDQIPKIEGYKFDGWNQSLKNITSDCFRLAMYSPINGNNDPNNNPNTTPGTNPNTTPGANPNTTPGANPNTTPGSDSNATPGTTPGANNGTNGKTNGNGTNNGNGSGKMYRLTVNYGSGSGDYAADTTVIIEAIDAPAGKVFDKWTVSGSSTPTIASATSKATTLKMPGGDCVVTANYKDASSKVSTGGTGRSGTAGGGPGGPGGPGRDTGTRVDIRKPGISNVDKAYAAVNGSTDNFIVKITESSEAANLVATALANKYGDMTPIKYFAMDISLYDATGTNKISNVEGLSVNVTMPLPDAMIQYAGNNRVGAVNGTTLEELPCRFVTVDGIPCVSFTATHFSPYTIYVDTNNMTYGIADSTPKTGDGIHPKWFASIALFCVSMVLFFKKDKISKKVRTA